MHPLHTQSNRNSSPTRRGRQRLPPLPGAQYHGAPGHSGASTSSSRRGRPSSREPNNRVFSDRATRSLRQLPYSPRRERTRAHPQPLQHRTLPPQAEPLRRGRVTRLFNTLKELPDPDLYTLFSQLTATSISHGHNDTPWDTPIKRLVAKETGLEVKDHFDASDPTTSPAHQGGAGGACSERWASRSRSRP